MSDHATIDEVREQLAQAMLAVYALVQNTDDLKCAAADTIARLETIATEAVEEMKLASGEIRVVADQLRQARGAGRARDPSTADDEADGALHVIGYGPPGTIGRTFASNAEATAVTGGCSHEHIRKCRDAAEADAYVRGLQEEIAAGVTAWARGFHHENVFAIAHGRLSSVLVFNDQDKRRLVDGVSGERSKQFRGRESARAWLLLQPMNPYWHRPGETREDTLLDPLEAGAEMPEVVVYCEHPELTGRHRDVARGRRDWMQEVQDSADDVGDGQSEYSMAESEATP